MSREESLCQMVGEWLAAWNSHSLEAILRHYAEDVVFQSPFVARLSGDRRGTIHGLAALRVYFEKALKAYPDLHFEPLQVLTGVDSVVIYYRSVDRLLAAETMQVDEQRLVIRVAAHYMREVGISGEAPTAEARAGDGGNSDE